MPEIYIMHLFEIFVDIGHYTWNVYPIVEPIYQILNVHQNFPRYSIVKHLRRSQIFYIFQKSQSYTETKISEIHYIGCWTLDLNMTLNA